MSKPMVEHIVDICAREYGVHRDGLSHPTRLAAYVAPRHVAMFLIGDMCGWTVSHIGQVFGGRSYRTTIEAIRKVERIIAKGGPEAQAIERIRKAVAEGVANG